MVHGESLKSVVVLLLTGAGGRYQAMIKEVQRNGVYRVRAAVPGCWFE